MSFPEEKKFVLYIKPAPGREDVVKELYDDHDVSYKGDSGLDLFCIERLIIPARAFSVAVPLGICTEAVYKETRNLKDLTTGEVWSTVRDVPTSYYIYPRSSMGGRSPLRLSNSTGIVDSSYRGELKMYVDNISDEPFTIEKGQRYVQICGPTLENITYKIVDSLSETERGEKGFGSSGK